MAIYLVTWDLNQEGSSDAYTRAKANLDSALDKLQTIKDLKLRTVRFVSTDWDADQLSNYLKAHIDTDDRILVTKMIKGAYQGWMHPDVWAWINSRI